ncbi:hypothetical protein PQR02_36915 [Paraburkholderia sediminicola]|uniref:Uncharacterized protein n=1 Tax=Paraburkholderia rhynchosiae TaxID=487049 RepID=A0ACC7NMP9_9BURK
MGAGLIECRLRRALAMQQRSTLEDRLGDLPDNGEELVVWRKCVDL